MSSRPPEIVIFAKILRIAATPEPWILMFVALAGALGAGPLLPVCLGAAALSISAWTRHIGKPVDPARVASLIARSVLAASLGFVAGLFLRDAMHGIG